MNKIAIIHDSYTCSGGAERVFLKLVQIFPDADIYTSLITPEFLKDLSKKTKGRINYSGLSSFKFLLDYADYFKPYILFYWKTLDLDKYDLILSSSHSFCSNWVRVRGKHISYIHTPPRYLYGVYNEMQFLRRVPFKYLFFPTFSLIRKLDYVNSKKIDLLVANSKNVQKRIKKYYGRNSTVVYPPVVIPKRVGKTSGREKERKGKYYLFFSRLVKQKGCELCIKAFNQNKKPLYVVGKGKEEKVLKKIANKNIKFLGSQTDRKMMTILMGAKALIYCSIEEDFGIVPLEAMGHGIPVIAYKSGGVKETVIEGKTGIFFHKYNEQSLNKAIDKFEFTKFSRNECIGQAQRFNEKIFEDKIRYQVRKVLGHS